MMQRYDYMCRLWVPLGHLLGKLKILNPIMYLNVYMLYLMVLTNPISRMKSPVLYKQCNAVSYVYLWYEYVFNTAGLSRVLPYKYIINCQVVLQK